MRGLIPLNRILAAGLGFVAILASGSSCGRSPLLPHSRSAGTV
jgi:hypothetical protein